MCVDVLIVDDHPIVREGLRMLLGGAPDLRLVGEAASGAEAVALLETGRADVILLDLDLQGEDGLAWLPAIAAAPSRPKVLVVTAIRDPATHARARAAGAEGVVTKHAPPGDIVAAIRAVHSGAAWFPSAHADVTQTLPPRPSPEAIPLPALTPREREILALLGEGLRNADIAQRLCVSEKTVRNQLSALYAKLGVSDRLELLVHAYRLGLTRPLS